jgi:uncharacterized protein YjbJ (UPF0337 family)
MNKDELKGKSENLSGRAKQAFGSLSGDKRTEAEGLFDRVRGALRDKFGKAKREASRQSRDVSGGDDDED